jgi:transcriptional regulator with XRE-family HTH domain
MRKTIHSKAYRLFLGELRDARVRAKLTQVDLAERLGATQTYVSKCERGERRIDVVELRQFCNAIGISLVTFARRLERTLAG